MTEENISKDPEDPKIINNCSVLDLIQISLDAMKDKYVIEEHLVVVGKTGKSKQIAAHILKLGISCNWVELQVKKYYNQAGWSVVPIFMIPLIKEYAVSIKMVLTANKSPEMEYILVYDKDMKPIGELRISSGDTNSGDTNNEK